MTAQEICDYLEDNGYPPHIVRGGAEGLIRRWQDFVAELEAGYLHRLEDYRHDLDLRGVIQTLGMGEDATVRNADERLRPLLTTPMSACGRAWRESRFWDFGYPRNASGDLIRDLTAAGLREHVTGRGAANVTRPAVNPLYEPLVVHVQGHKSKDGGNGDAANLVIVAIPAKNFSKHREAPSEQQPDQSPRDQTAMLQRRHRVRIANAH